MSILVEYSINTNSLMMIEIHRGTILEPEMFSFVKHPNVMYEPVVEPRGGLGVVCSKCCFESSTDSELRQMCYSAPECLPKRPVKIAGILGAFGTSADRRVYYRVYVPDPVNRIDVLEVDI